MKFDKECYQEIMRRYNYGPIDFSIIDFGLKNLEAEDLNRKYVCHFNGDSFSEGIREEKSIVTTGFGLSGKPHLGTISQIMHAINLQESGLEVQIVLGDFDSYNARGKSLKEVKELSSKYKDFIRNLGFDEGNGILRNQRDGRDVLHTSYLISKYLTDEDFIRAEEGELSEIYKREGVYEGVTFPVKQAMLLMTGDFINLGIKEGFRNVLVSLGIEEHRYVKLADKVIDRSDIEMNIGGIYSKLIKGFNGYPKMSKSIPESNIDVDAPEEEIKDKIMNPGDEYEDPQNSVVYQMMSLVSDYSPERLSKLEKLCEEKGGGWELAKGKYIGDLINILNKW